MSHLQFIDELVREYLLFRGFGGTLKSFDGDLKVDKDKGFRVDKIVDQLVQYIYTYDLTGLRELWNHLDARLFSRLELHFTQAIKKLENGVLKFYLVYASENNKTDKITEFFNKMTSELIGQSEWKDWFVLPYIKNPEENATFAVYFTKQWQDTLLVSLHNCLSAVYQCMPLPTISNFEENASKMMNLQKENEMLRKGLANLMSQEDGGVKSVDTIQGMDPLTDDFYNISQEIRTTENQTKILKSLMRNLSGTMPTSPKISQKALSQPAAGPSKTETRKHISKKTQASKRSVSTDARPSGSSKHKDRDTRDASLDVVTSRGGQKDDHDKVQEPGFLFLSQEEYNEHKVEILTARFNSRGSSVASADIEGNLKIWTVAPVCKTSCSFSVKASLTCLDWVPNHERYIICGSTDGYIRLFDTKEVKLTWEQQVYAEQHHTGSRIDDVVCTSSDSGIIVISAGKVLLYDLKAKRYEKTLNAGRGQALCCAVNHNGSTLLVGCEDGGLDVVDLRRNEVIESAQLCSGGPVVQVHFATDFTACYALSNNNRLYYKLLSPLRDRVEVLTIPGEVTNPSTRGRLFCLDCTGTFLLVGGVNSGIIYKIQEKTLVKILELGGHKSQLTCVDWCFANQCGTCVTASQDGRLRISTLLVDII